MEKSRDTLVLTRRSLLTMGALGVLGGALGCRPESDGRAAFEAEDVGAELLAAPAVGELAVADAAALGLLFERMAAVWQLHPAGSDTDRLRQGLEGFLKTKTTRAPSYLAEYESAARIVEGRSRDGLEALLLSDFSMSEAPRTRLDHLRHYVVAELAVLHMTLGGFKRFGYRNYAGYMGGRPSPKPFR